MGSSVLTEPRTGRPGGRDPRRETVIEDFLVEARPWALRQARRRFPHIPHDLYEDVYQQACAEIWQREPRSLDKRSLYAYLAKVLTGVLGRAHRAWVHDHAPLIREDGDPVAVPDPGPAPDSQHDRRHLAALLHELMNRRLLAPERAVLQLQLGAGLDPGQVRRALDMSPRQYKRRRAEGLAKLRDALDDYLHGRVCEDHAALLAMAATGDLPAGSAEQLHSHLEHCGACRAEIRRVRATVRHRFAAAPWPLAIPVPGWLALKLGGGGTMVGGGAGTAGSGGAVKLAATAATFAAVAGAGTGALAVTGAEPPGSDPAPAPAAATGTAPEPQAAAPDAWAAGSPARAAGPPEPRRGDRRRGGSRDGGGQAGEGSSRERGEQPAEPAPTAAAPGAEAGGAPGTSGNALADAAAPLTDVVADTRQALEGATREATEHAPAPPLPKPQVPSPDVGGAVETVTNGATEAAGGAAKGAGGLLSP